jgi:hypothetical protein
VCAAALLGAASALAQSPTPRPTPFSERVEVNVRTVLVRITGPDGKPPSPPPGVEDIEVREDGAPARVLGVDPARPSPARGAPTPPPAEAEGRETAPAPAAPAAAPIPQHLYVDTTMLEPGSVRRLAAAFEKNLDAVLANGTLEIVVADPVPRQTLEATRDREAARKALQDLGRSVAGKQSLVLVRRQTADTLTSGFCVNYESQSRNAAEQELRLIQDSLDRLLTWAASLGGQRPDVVFYVSDGFDSDVSETYRRMILQRTSPVPALCQQNETPQQIASNLASEFSARSNSVVGLAARSLASLGVEAVPLALGGDLIDTGGDASVPGQDVNQFRGGAIPLFVRRLEPLRTISQATGGEVVTSPSQIPSMLDAFGNAYVVAFRSAVAPDGKPHSLAITSRRPGLSVRAPTALGEATPASIARGQTVRALHEVPAPGGFSVRLAIDGVQKSGKGYAGVLHVDADLAPLLTSLEALGGGRLRLTIAADVEGAREPYTTNQEFDVAKDQGAFGADVPITWPRKTRKIAVTVEELKTGARSTAATDVPRPE